MSATPTEHPTAPDVAPVALKLVVVAAVMAGLALRFLTRSPLWLDEALSVNISALPPGAILDALRHDGHPPLYYVLLHYWMQVFGSGDAATRALSAAFGVASLPLAWVIGRRRGGTVLGWVFVGVLAMSPYALRYGSEARMYSMVSLLVLVGYVLIDDVVRRGRATTIGLVGIAAVAASLLLSHYWSMWLLGAVALVMLWLGRRADEPAVRSGAVRALLALCVGGVAFLWWAPAMLYQSAHTGTPWSSSVRPTVTVSYVLNDFAAATGFPDSPFLTVLTSLLFALGLFGTARGRFAIELDLRTNRQLRFEGLVIAITLTIGIAVGFATRSAFASRYASVFFPLFVLIVATGVTRFSDARLRVGVMAVVVLAGALGGGYNAFIYGRTQAGELAEVIRAQGKPGDVVVFCPDQLGPSGSRALGPGFDTMAFPRLDSPALVDWVDYAVNNAAIDPKGVARRVLARAGESRSIFVVWSGTYKTLEHKCEEMIAEISAARPVSKTLRDAQTEKYYESATLSWFGPPPDGARAP